jgi:aerobic carbon-monoxide dehydrogenase medium subunit
MCPASFDYLRPASVAEAVQLLSRDGVKALAGGHSLIPAMNLRTSQPSALVDIGRLEELRGICMDGDRLIIGALTTHAQVAASADVQQHCAALASACSVVGDPQVRNWGTLGGNLAHADPASDPPTVAVACNAVIHTQGPNGKRAIGAENFFLDVLSVDLQPGELITSVEFASLSQWRSAYVKLPHPASRYAVVGVCVALHLASGVCDQARVAVGGATAKPTRAPLAEKALIGSPLDAAAQEAAAGAISQDIGDQAMSDIYANATYRRAMAGVLLKRAVKAAMA